jgi:two-component system, OmpR family, KDP operon response regulator KdpE
MSARILVIDDEPQIQRFMRISLTQEGFEFYQAQSAAEGLRSIRTNKPDLVILDLGLPDQDGFQLLRQFRQWSSVPVLVLTARDAEEEKVKLLEGGANDYLSKPFGIKELIARVRVLLRDLNPNGIDSDAASLCFAGLRINQQQHSVFLDEQLLPLSPKEYAILCFLAQSPGKLITQQQLLEKFWGATHNQDTHYLRIFISQLRKKLNDSPDSPRYIQTEPGVGYRFIAQPASSVN